VNCWQGLVNGSVGFVEAGVGGRYSDQAQGIIIYQPHYYDYHQQYIYNTPQRVGAVRIISVDGSRVTLAPVDPNAHVTLVFDLATRQWVNP